MNFSLTKDTITPELKRVLGEVKRPVVLYQAGAKAVQMELTRHLRTLQMRGNKKGWPDKHFFAGAADSVERRVGIASVTETSAVVTISDPRFYHRITGGTVVPKRAKFLAIPLNAAAYRASGKGTLRESMPGLEVWKFKRGLFLIKQVEEKRTKSGKVTKGKGGGVSRIRVILMFRLVRSVTHRPKPEEKPDLQRLSTAARTGMLRAAQILLRAKPS